MGDVCCICLETLESGIASRLLKCQHRIHYTCLQEYTEWKYTTCPLCRQSLDIHSPANGHIVNILSIISLVVFGFFYQYIMDHPQLCLFTILFTIIHIIEYVIYIVFCSFLLYILLFFLAYISTLNIDDDDDD